MSFRSLFLPLLACACLAITACVTPGPALEDRFRSAEEAIDRAEIAVSGMEVAGIISADDGAKAYGLIVRARSALDLAKAAFAAGDRTSADASLHEAAHAAEVAGAIAAGVHELNPPGSTPGL